MKQKICREMELVEKEAAAKLEKLQYAENLQSGLELLHLFLLDILGRNTPVAKIFQTKSQEE